MGNQQQNQYQYESNFPITSHLSKQNKSHYANISNFNQSIDKDETPIDLFSGFQRMDTVNSKLMAKTEDILGVSILSKTDENIKNKLVKSRLGSLPGMKYKSKHESENLEMINSTTSAYSILGAIELQDNIKGKFMGETIDGKPNGFGKLYFANGDYLEGQFQNGRCNGQGRYIKSNGSYYEGSFKNNEADGHGKYEDIKGYRYEGMWKRNLPNGQGEVCYEDGSRYIGQFLNNKRCGVGTFMVNGDIYKGSFENNKIHGQCQFYGMNGQKFSGQWKKGLKSGKGTFQWPNGMKYEGEYKNDQRQGFGIMYYPNNEKFEGNWKDGKKHGQGKFSSSKQSIQGLWVKGQLKQLIDN